MNYSVMMLSFIKPNPFWIRQDYGIAIEKMTARVFDPYDGRMEQIIRDSIEAELLK